MTIEALSGAFEPPPVPSPGVYTYFSTDWRTGNIREELPLRGVSFGLPLSGHGDLRGAYTVPRGQGSLRAAAAPVVSGLLVCRDDRPVWEGMLWADRQTGPRTFDVSASEWGSVFERAVISKAFLAAVNSGNPLSYNTDDHTIFRDLITKAQAYAGQNYGIQVGAGAGPTRSELNVPWWDLATIEDVFTELGNREGGPEWAFTVTGTVANPVRRLLLGTPLGRSTVAASGLLLEYVEDTGPAPAKPEGPPRVTTSDTLFPGVSDGVQVASLHGSGGNVIAVPGVDRDGGGSATEYITVGAGEEADMMTATATATDLLGFGWPRLTRKTAYKDVSRAATLQGHAAADLAASKGLTVVVRATTFGHDPDWTQVQRGDAVRVELDTDVHGPRPYVLESRVLGLDVAPSDEGGHEQVTFTVAGVQRGF